MPVVFIIFRLMVLATSLDLFDFEELDIGMMAKEAAGRKTLPYLANLMPYHAHTAGMLISGLLGSGFYKLFGESGMSLKLCWLLISFVTFVLFLSILKKYFGDRIAILASCIFILSPPFFTWYNLVETADKNICLLFIMLLTLFSFKMLPFRNNTMKDYVLYGLTSGLAVSSSHYCLFILFVGILYQLWFNWRIFFRRYIFILFLSFLTGLSPWLYLHKLYSFEWFEYILCKSGPLSIDRWDKFNKFMTETLPHSFGFGDFFMVSGETLDYIYYFLCILLFVLVISSARKINFGRLKQYLKDPANKTSFIYLFIGAYILVYTFGKFSIDGQSKGNYRYLLMLYPFIFMSTAIWVDRLEKKNMAMKIAGWSIFGSLCILGLVGNLSMIDLKNRNFKNPSIYTPYSFTWLGPKIYRYVGQDNAKLKSCIDSLQRNSAPYLRLGIYKKLREGSISEPGTLFEDYKSLNEYGNLFYEGLGSSIGRFFLYKPVFQIEIIKKLPFAYSLNSEGILNEDAVYYFMHNPEFCKKITEKLSNGTKNFYYEKVGFTMGILLKSHYGIFLRFTNKAKNGPVHSLIKGFGSGIAVYNTINDIIEVSRKIDDEYGKDYFEGVGFTLGLYFAQNKTRIMDIGDKINIRFRGNYYKGVGYAVGWNFVNDPTLILRLIGTNLDFPPRHYDLLPLGLYGYITDLYKKAYCKGLGYGIAPYISENSMGILDKLVSYFAGSDEESSVSKGINDYFCKEMDNS